MSSAGEGQGSVFNVELPLFSDSAGSSDPLQPVPIKRSSVLRFFADLLPIRRGFPNPNGSAFMNQTVITDRSAESLCVLVVDPDILSAEILTNMLKGSVEMCSHVADCTQALRRVAESPLTGELFDIVVVQSEAINGDAGGLVAEMRAIGFEGRIIAVLDHSRGTEESLSLTLSGMDKVLRWPLTVRDLLGS